MLQNVCFCQRYTTLGGVCFRPTADNSDGLKYDPTRLACQESCMPTETVKFCTKCGKPKAASRDNYGSTPSGNLRGECRACVRERSKKHDANNPARSTKRGNKPSDSHSYLLGQKLAEQDHQCVYCGTQIDRVSCQLDHKTPTSRGGADTADNLQALCRKCNQEKHSKTHQEHLNWRKKVGMD